MDIPFAKPKSLLSTNRKRGAHLYSNSVPLSDLPQCSQSLQDDQLELTSTEPEVSTTQCDSEPIALLSVNDNQTFTNFSFSRLLCNPPTDEEKLEYLSGITQLDPVIASIVSPFSDKFKTSTPVASLPPSLRDLYRPENEELTYMELIAVCEQVTLTITEEEATTIEMATQDQSKSTAWFVQRAGRITASMMKHVCATDPGNPAQSLIHRICYPGANKFSCQATKWGCEHETLAKSAYANTMKDTHQNFTCKDSGLIVSHFHPFIGASPDGVIQCDCCGKGVLEVKCPYCIHDGEPSSAPYIHNGSLSRSHVYFYQVQTQMYVCSASYADFVVATFCDGAVNIFTERILPDDKFITDIVTKSGCFLSFVSY